MATIPVRRAVHRPTLQQLLEAEADELERLAGEARRGVRDQAHFDALESWAAEIGRRVRAAFRQVAR